MDFAIEKSGFLNSIFYQQFHMNRFKTKFNFTNSQSHEISSSLIHNPLFHALCEKLFPFFFLKELHS